jgi:hypothetical protein
MKVPDTNQTNRCKVILTMKNLIDDIDDGWIDLLHYESDRRPKITISGLLTFHQNATDRPKAVDLVLGEEAK